jgi:hypothetical protein
LFFWSFVIFECIGNQLIAGIVEIQHEIKSPSWSGKTNEGQASPTDFHNTAKIMSDKDVSYTAYHCWFKQLWNLVSKLLSESTLIFNFNADDVM